MLKKICITGNIGSGKTTVAKLFEQSGIPVFYADKEAQKCYDIPKIKQKIKFYFGDDIYDGDVLNRKKLGSIVFNDKDKLELLNLIIHPEVHHMFNLWIKTKTWENEYVLYETALVFERKFTTLFDKIITVYCPEEMRIDRVMKRDSCTREEVLSRMSNQLSDEYKKDNADYVIINDGRDLKQQIDMMPFYLF